MITKFFKDRAEGGRFLARKLMQYANDPNVVVLALPRGGVPVAYEVAQTLKAPLDVFVVRKLGIPGFQECAMGAIASGGIRVISPAALEPCAADKGGCLIAQGSKHPDLDLLRRPKTCLPGGLTSLDGGP